MEETSKDNHYEYHKSLVKVEKYSILNSNCNIKIVLANLRCSCHQLLTEKGRHLDIDVFPWIFGLLRNELHFFSLL